MTLDDRRFFTIKSDLADATPAQRDGYRRFGTEEVRLALTLSAPSDHELTWSEAEGALYADQTAAAREGFGQ